MQAWALGRSTLLANDIKCHAYDFVNVPLTDEGLARYHNGHGFIFSYYSFALTLTTSCCPFLSGLALCHFLVTIFNSEFASPSLLSGS